MEIEKILANYNESFLHMFLSLGSVLCCFDFLLGNKM